MSASVTTILIVGRLVIVGAEGFERQVGRHQRQHRRVGMGLAAVNDEGALEPEPVAGRAADDRDLLERHLQGGDDRLLAPAEAIDQEDAEHASRHRSPAARRRGRRADDLVSSRPASTWKLARSRIGRAMKAKCRRRKPIATTAPSLQPSGVISPAVVQPTTGRRAEAAGDLGREGRGVIVGRDEHDEAGEVMRRKLPGDFGSRGGRRPRSTPPRRRRLDRPPRRGPRRFPPLALRPRARRACITEAWTRHAGGVRDLEPPQSRPRKRAPFWGRAISIWKKVFSEAAATGRRS